MICELHVLVYNFWVIRELFLLRNDILELEDINFEDVSMFSSEDLRMYPKLLYKSVLPTGQDFGGARFESSEVCTL